MDGVDKNNEKIAEISDSNGTLNITIDDMVVYRKNINKIEKYDVPVYLRINDKSASSSQLIAIIFLQKLGESHVYGEAPSRYTNGSGINRSYSQDQVVMPYYFFRDSRGIVHKDGLIRGGSILSEFSSSPFINEKLLIDPNKTVNDQHLRAIIHNEYFDNNNHSRIEYDDPRPGMKIIDGKTWVFFPTKYEYKPEHPEKKIYHKEIIEECKELYTNINSIYQTNPDMEFVVDLRSFSTRGKDLFQTLAPFIQSKKLETDFTIVMSAVHPFLLPRGESKSGFMESANVTFIMDKGTAQLKDVWFCCLLNNLGRPNYKILGDIGIYSGKASSQFKVKIPKKYLVKDSECIIRLPTLPIPIPEISPLTDEYRPYKIGNDI